MGLNLKIFFDEIRPKLFSAGFNQSQVDGTDYLISTWDQYFKAMTPYTQLAVCLATTYHETARTMQPIAEYGNREYFRLNYDVTGRNPDRARRYGNTEPGDGVKFRGRGYVQLTWQVNYKKATERLKAKGLILKEVDFVLTPDLVMSPGYAAMIMFLGMEEGWFTGKTLDQLVDPVVDGDEHADAVRARAIINGTDKAEQIAKYSDIFLQALLKADTPDVLAPTKQPEAPEVVVERKKTWIEALLGFFTRKG